MAKSDALHVPNIWNSQESTVPVALQNYAADQGEKNTKKHSTILNQLK